MKTHSMTDLLASEDILREPRTIAAWHGLIGPRDAWFSHSCTFIPEREAYTKCSKCGYDPEEHSEPHPSCPIPQPITCSIYEAAWRMADACDMIDHGTMLLHVIDNDKNYKSVQPTHWIVAATLAWEGAEFTK